MSGIKDKVVIITGASSGIGEATARILAAHGARVVLGARRTERLETLAGLIRTAGGIAEYQALDVTQRGQLEDIVALAKSRFGRGDVCPRGEDARRGRDVAARADLDERHLRV